ncbi:hypothetical protein H2200_004764 [Cladophialophora chaetospira]|uniref:Uncharacterized protein n=1 Tax=Cladophialophora chaetospira TaxID=386627 RepID=A0AA38XDV7_9EURO|nr:hypothetical protein H2200_004764 [Cladophialophora chaetospira]
MNSPATIFIRACRASPEASQKLLRGQASAKAVPPSSAASTSRTLSIPFRRRAPPSQRAFSSRCLLKQAQPINDIPPAASEGLDATILGKTSDDGSNLPASTISRVSTDSSPWWSASSSTPNTSTTPPPSSEPPPTTSSYDAALLPPSLPQSDLTFLTTTPSQTATVTRINTMNRTVRATHNIQLFHAAYQKHYTRPTHALVHDPHNLLLLGDVIRYGEFPPSLRQKRDEKGKIVVKRGRPRDRNGVVKELGVRNLVREILSPFGVPLEQRSPRVVGGEKGRWKGTGGEVKKIAVRQKGRKVGVKKARKTAGAGATGKGVVKGAASS